MSSSKLTTIVSHVNCMQIHQRQKNGRWKIPPYIEELKLRAKALGLWNVFLPKSYKEGAGLTNVEYAQLAEIMGRFPLASEACNCSAPDTGNMETIAKYGTAEQKDKYLKPLMNGDVRSVFLMTEPAVASSDATNIETKIERQGDYYLVNGRKWVSGSCSTVVYLCTLT
jgi:acyl-CoA dehydrogenase